MMSLAKRSLEKELIDDLDFGGDELLQTLRELKTINKLLGGNYVTTNGIQQLIRNHTARAIRIADVGCGGGDMIRVMYDWAKKKKLDATFFGVDANPFTIDMAAHNLKSLPGISFETSDVFSKRFQQAKTDSATNWKTRRTVANANKKQKKSV